MDVQRMQGAVQVAQASLRCPRAVKNCGHCACTRLPTIAAMNQVDVCVRGAGAVGSCLALALARQGLSVALQRGAARSGPAPREDVRVYALNAGSVQLLRELKVWEALPADARCAVYDMHVEGDAAGSALDFSAWSRVSKRWPGSST